LLDTAALRNVVQASDVEISQGLLGIDAVVIDGWWSLFASPVLINFFKLPHKNPSLIGKWRIFEEKYVSKFMDIFSTIVTVSGWSYGAIPYAGLCTEIEEHDNYPRQIVFRLLEVFSADTVLDDATTFNISLEKIARFQGRHLLSLGKVGFYGRLFFSS